MTHDYDFCVVGAGSAGYAAATIARDLGKSVALVEGNEPLGGLCILRGCMPSKTLLRSAEIAHLVRHAADQGIEAGPPRVNFSAVMARKRRIIKEFADFRIAGIDQFPLLRGRVEFVSGSEVRAGDHSVRARKFLIATGSIINIPGIKGLGETGYYTSDDILELDALPKSVIVLGGGPTACELSQYLARLGVSTTIVQRSRTLLSGEDDDVGSYLQLVLEREDITVLAGTSIVSVSRGAGGPRVVFEREGKRQTVEAEALFVSLGRRPAVEGLGLERAGVTYDAHGIKVDRHLRTSNPDIFAAGDVLHDSSQLVHVAVLEGQTAARNALADASETIDYDLQGSRAIFTDPQIGLAGLSEKTCRERNITYATAVYPFEDLGKAISTDLTSGFVKLIAAPDGRLLGAAIVGAEASDLIHEAITLLYFGANCRDIMRMPHLHPTLAEIITYPAEELCERLEKEKRALVTP